VIDKRREDALGATAPVASGQTVAIGGFGRAGIPLELIDAVCQHDVRDLHVISNNAGKDGRGVARLVHERRVRKLTCSFPGTAEFFEQYFHGACELELVPQGTLVERLRAAGAGIGAFYTRTSAGTLLSTGGLAASYDEHSQATQMSAPKEVRRIGEFDYVLEYPFDVDVALVKGYRADRYGNVRFRLSAQNFNPLCAMAARHSIAEVEILGDELLDPDDVHLPGIFVSSVVRAQPSPIVREQAPPVVPAAGGPRG
jgi:acyl CoA:acetate/3-ketoacid CoA transferase alpha subunit